MNNMTMTDIVHENGASTTELSHDELAVPQPSRLQPISNTLNSHESTPPDTHGTTITSAVDILSSGQCRKLEQDLPLESGSIRVTFNGTHNVFADCSEMSVRSSEEEDVLNYTVNPPTFDQPSGERSRHNYDLWKWYRGGFGVDSISLSPLLHSKPTDIELRVGANLMFDTEINDNKQSDKAWALGFGRGRCGLTLNGRPYNFYTIPNLLRFSRQADLDALKVELTFQTIYPSEKPVNTRCVHSPLRNRLGTMLSDGPSAVSLFKGNIDIGMKLLTYDILSATIACWIDFLKLVRLRSAWKSYSFKDLQSIEKLRPLLGDRANVSDFEKSVRDLQQAVEVTLKTIDLEVDFDDDENRKRDFKRLRLYRDSQLKVLQSKVDDIRSNMEDFADRTKASVEEKEAASLKRLTLVASIFLPLTTACSMLSMTNRVSDMGAIWWDWLGIVAILGFIVLVGYRFWKAMDNLWHESDKQVRFRKWNDEWGEAARDVLDEESDRKQQRRQDPDWRPRFSDGGLRFQRKHLIPGFNRNVFLLSKYLFSTGVVASFLIGMFIGIPTGAKCLGYSAAGTVGLAVISILINKFLKHVNRAFFENARSSRASADVEAQIHHQSAQDERSSDGRKKAAFLIVKWVVSVWMMSLSSEPAQEVNKQILKNPLVKLLLKILRWPVAIPLLLICRLGRWIAAIFLGERTLEVARRALRARLEDEDPELLGQLKECLDHEIWKRRNRDLEANHPRGHQHSSSDPFSDANGTG